MAALINRVLFRATSTGTGSFVVASAITGYMTPATGGAVNATVYSYAAESDSKTEWEIGTGTYTTGDVTLTRTPLKSSNADAAVNFTAAPKVALTALAGDIQPYSANLDEYAAVNPTAAGLALLDDAAASDQRTTLGLGTAAVVDTGTSGTTIPLLDGTNTWSGVQTITSTAASTAFRVESTNAGAGAGPIIQIARDSASPAANDFLGDIDWMFRNASGTELRAAQFVARLLVATAGAESTQWYVATYAAGTLAQRMLIEAGLYMQGTTGGDPGVGGINAASIRQSGAPLWASPVTKTADFTVANTETSIINNKAGSTCTVTLPTASSFPGRQLRFKNSQAQTVVSASSNVVPRVTAAAGTAILASGSGQWCIMESDATNWVIMAGS